MALLAALEKALLAALETALPAALETALLVALDKAQPAAKAQPVEKALLGAPCQLVAQLGAPCPCQ